MTGRDACCRSAAQCRGRVAAEEGGCLRNAMEPLVADCQWGEPAMRRDVKRRVDSDRVSAARTSMCATRLRRDARDVICFATLNAALAATFEHG